MPLSDPRINPAPRSSFSLMAPHRQSVFEVIEVDDAMNDLKAELLKPRFGRRRCKGI